jgi:hypothetical protein
MCTSADMQKHPSSLALIAEIFFVIGRNFSKGSHCFARILVKGSGDYDWFDKYLLEGLIAFFTMYFIHFIDKEFIMRVLFINLLWIQHFSWHYEYVENHALCGGKCNPQISASRNFWTFRMSAHQDQDIRTFTCHLFKFSRNIT